MSLQPHDFFWAVIIILVLILAVVVADAINNFISRRHIPSAFIPHLPPKVDVPTNEYEEWYDKPPLGTIIPTPPKKEVDPPIPDEGDSFVKFPDRKPWT